MIATSDDRMMSGRLRNNEDRNHHKLLILKYKKHISVQTIKGTQYQDSLHIAGWQMPTHLSADAV